MSSTSRVTSPCLPSADVEIGRSTYVLEASGRLVASDSILQDDGGWRVFAMLRATRTNR